MHEGGALSHPDRKAERTGRGPTLGYVFEPRSRNANPGGSVSNPESKCEPRGGEGEDLAEEAIGQAPQILEGTSSQQEAHSGLTRAILRLGCQQFFFFSRSPSDMALRFMRGPSFELEAKVTFGT